MIRKYIGYLFLAACCFGATSCDRDEITPGSNFDTTAPERNAFDQWLLKNYVAPYNIDVKYKWEDIESNLAYDLAPVKTENAIKLSKIVKYVWLEAYDEVAGIDFMRTYVPKQIMLIGSSAYNADTQTEMLGTAEGGMKVMLYNVNYIDNYIQHPEQLNTSYFHVMHHEFSHILHQTKPYSTDFKTITESGYIGSQWEETADSTAHKRGFVTPYAMEQPDEDFAETLSTYITQDQASWDAMLKDCGEEGAQLVTLKLELVKTYMQESWNIDMDELRSVVQRRCSEIHNLDLENIN